MEIGDKAKVIAYLIDNVFVPECGKQVDLFLQEYKKDLEFRINYKIVTGHDIEVRKEPIVLNFTQPAQHLYRNLIATLQQ